MITNGALNLASNTTVNGEQIITTPPACFDGQILSCDAASGLWDTTQTSLIKMLTAYWPNDCNDLDPNLLGVVNDADCDGILTLTIV